MIDDNPNKWGRLIEGIPIVGGREEHPGGRGKVSHRSDPVRHPDGVGGEASETS